MDGQRFDALAKALISRGSRRHVVGVIAALTSMVTPGWLASSKPKKRDHHTAKVRTAGKGKKKHKKGDKKKPNPNGGSKNIDVPFLTQLGSRPGTSDGGDNCGPASLAMAIDYYNPGAIDVGQAAMAIRGRNDEKNGFTNFKWTVAKNLLSSFSLCEQDVASIDVLRGEIARGRPVIVLVANEAYRSLHPYDNDKDSWFVPGDHIVVVTGYTPSDILVNDPLRHAGDFSIPNNMFIQAATTTSSAPGRWFAASVQAGTGGDGGACGGSDNACNYVGDICQATQECCSGLLCAENDCFLGGSCCAPKGTGCTDDCQCCGNLGCSTASGTCDSDGGGGDPSCDSCDADFPVCCPSGDCCPAAFPVCCLPSPGFPAGSCAPQDAVCCVGSDFHCPADSPVCCSDGGCCYLDYPICGSDGLCYQVERDSQERSTTRPQVRSSSSFAKVARRGKRRR